MVVVVGESDAKLALVLGGVLKADTQRSVTISGTKARGRPRRTLSEWPTSDVFQELWNQRAIFFQLSVMQGVFRNHAYLENSFHEMVTKSEACVTSS